ncbi:MAG: FecR family protein [Elusimicrobiales bacterium]|nr:FecR family protein [Elusimicrobiales bacterium]
MKQLLVSALLLLTLMPARAAYIDSWRGEVDHKKNGEQDWSRLYSDDKVRLASGDELRTGRASTVEILMDDGSRVKLAPITSFRLTAEGKEAVTLGLYFGRVRSWVKKFSKKFEVRTPSAVCAVRGTDFMVASDAEGNSRVEVYDGSVLTGDAKGNSNLVREGQYAEIPAGGRMRQPSDNPNQPGDMNSAVGDPVQQARNEIYNEISKEDVISRAQEELQSAEFQSRKVAIDAFGNRVRMEEYVIRPAANQFKYVVLNTRQSRFDFGKMLFTFDSALPSDLSLATRNMTSAVGASAPQWQLTAMNSVMSNTLDKVTEDASGGKMVPDNAGSPSEWTHFFTDYAVYAAGPDQAAENGGLGRRLWGYTDANADNTVQIGELTYLGGAAPAGLVTYPGGEDVFHTVTRNTYSDADNTWIQASDYVLFDSGDILNAGDFSSRLGVTMDTATDRLNFERVYTSSLFGGRKIDLEFSAKLLKDAGLLRF